MVGVAVVGYGYWGPNHVRTFDSLPGCSVKYICDSDKDRLATAKQRHPHLRASGDLDTVLADPEVDAVALITAAPTHCELTLRCLAAGKHTFVEKPMALTGADAEKMVRSAEKNDRILMVGHLLEYHPAVTMLRAYIDEGQLGDIHYIYTTRVNLGVVRSEENALWSLAPHDVSIILYLFGEAPVAVAARGADYVQQSIEDVVFCTLHFASGRMAHIHVSWLDPHKIRKVTIVGSKQMAVFDDMQGEEMVKVYDKGIVGDREPEGYGQPVTVRTGDIHLPRVKMAEPLKIEDGHFIECVAEGKTPLSDGWDGLRVIRVLEAATESLQKGGATVELAPTQSSVA